MWLFKKWWWIFRLTRLVEVYDYKDGMTLISELATGGELLDAITSNKYVTEIEVARIVQQILEGIEYMHSKSIGHLGKVLKFWYVGGRVPSRGKF